MKSLTATLLCISLAGAGCAGEFGSVGRTTRISDGSRVTASSIVPDDANNRGIIEHLALAEEIYAKQLDDLRARRGTLRSRRRTLTLATYATFAATTLVIGAAAIRAEEMSEPNSDLRVAGYGALGGLGLGTTLEVVNLMQEDPANVEGKIRHLQSSYDNMVDRLRELFEDAATFGDEVTPQSVELKAGPIIEAFINEALQISVKG
jgi:hypothetical protein